MKLRSRQAFKFIASAALTMATLLSYHKKAEAVLNPETKIKIMEIANARPKPACMVYKGRLTHISAKGKKRTYRKQIAEPYLDLDCRKESAVVLTKKTLIHVDFSTSRPEGFTIDLTEHLKHGGTTYAPLSWDFSENMFFMVTPMSELVTVNIRKNGMHYDSDVPFSVSGAKTIYYNGLVFVANQDMLYVVAPYDSFDAMTAKLPEPGDDFSATKLYLMYGKTKIEVRGPTLDHLIIEDR